MQGDRWAPFVPMPCAARSFQGKLALACGVVTDRLLFMRGHESGHALIPLVPRRLR
jgi:hypothetical protein